MISIYYPTKLYNSGFRGHLFPLLKPFIKGEGFTDKERLAMYHISEKHFQLTEDINKADWAILPMSWNYYTAQNKLKQAKDFVALAKQHHKIVLSFTNGDFGVQVPNIKNVFVLRQSGERSKLPEFHIGMPSFINDPLKVYFKTDTISFNSYSSKPTIGFCGQTNDSFLNTLVEISRTFFRNLKYVGKLSSELPQKIQSTNRLRSKVLQKIKNASLLDDRFIERKKYRAGAITKEQRQKTTQEFYKNINETDYTVCVRGAGNFSVRFYETLAMGRIPIFVNTDCILPLATEINWKKHVVWIEENELHLIEEKTIQFHNNLSLKEFRSLQISNRKLWEEQLTLGGFFKTFLNA